MWHPKKGISCEKYPQMLIGGRALQTGQTQEKNERQTLTNLKHGARHAV